MNDIINNRRLLEEKRRLQEEQERKRKLQEDEERERVNRLNGFGNVTPGSGSDNIPGFPTFPDQNNTDEGFQFPKYSPVGHH